MTVQNKPSIPRRRVARRLRRMREQAGLTLEQAAPRLDKTRSALGRIENGYTAADVHLVRTMMDVYDQYDPGLLDLVRHASRPGWWLHYGIRDPDYLGLETEATTLRNSQVTLIPGLLQTEDYMRAVFAAVHYERSARDIDNAVGARLHRQRRLTDPDNPLNLIALVDEAALRRLVGGPTVMAAQVRHLIEASALDTVSLQVIPDDVGAYAAMECGFALLDFEDDEDPRMLYIAYPTGTAHVDKPDAVHEASRIFEHDQRAALAPSDSVTFLEQLVAER